MKYCLTSSGVIAAISGWVIWPTFSASVMPARIFATRFSSDRLRPILLSTLGHSESVGSFLSMRAQPRESRAGLPITGCRPPVAVSAPALGIPVAPADRTARLASTASPLRRAPGRAKGLIIEDPFFRQCDGRGESPKSALRRS